MEPDMLKFDTPVVNTDLAQEYLKKTDIKSIEPIMKNISNIEKICLAKQLAAKISDHQQLICQLEYLTRKIPIRDTTDNITLMVDNLLNLNFDFMASDLLDTKLLSVEDETPLALLGYTNCCQSVLIQSTEKRTAVCHLFTKLCHEVGLKHVAFVVHSDSTKDAETMYCDPECFSSIGVITEKCDLDSAVEAFITSSSKCIWKLQRVLVQESVYDSFKKAIEWKTKLNGTQADVDELRKLCTDLFVYKDKLFLVDYAGNEDNVNVGEFQNIYVEAYRTTKELLSLIKTLNPSCLSLWSSDVSESNEIVYNVDASMIWINDFGTLSKGSSRWFYSSLIKHGVGKTYNTIDVPKDIVTKYETWRKLRNEDRIKIIFEVLQSNCDNGDLVTEELLDRVLNLKDQKTIDVNDGKICIQLGLPVGIVKVKNVKNIFNILEYLANGNAIIYKGDRDAGVLQTLKNSDVPILINSSTSEGPSTKMLVSNNFPYHYKVIVTNFGTIFAN